MSRRPRLSKHVQAKRGKADPLPRWNEYHRSEPRRHERIQAARRSWPDSLKRGRPGERQKHPERAQIRARRRGKALLIKIARLDYPLI